MGMAAPTYYTAEMVRQMPDDGNTYEVVHGELLVTPAPRVWHQLVAQRLGTALGEYLRYQPIGHVFAARSDISWGLDDVLVEPDVFVAPLDQVQTLDWAQIRHLLLAVEILSPSSVRYDRFTKRGLYQEQGVPLYWIVDGDAQSAERGIHLVPSNDGSAWPLGTARSRLPSWTARLSPPANAASVTRRTPRRAGSATGSFRVFLAIVPYTCSGESMGELPTAGTSST